MSHSMLITPENVYYGPNIHTFSATVDGSGNGTATSQEAVAGYIDQVIITDAAHSVTVTLSRATGSETIFTKTGVASGLIARPMILEQKAEDGTNLTTRRRHYVLGESLTLTLASGTEGDEIEVTVITTPF